MKRLFDFTAALGGLVVLSPLIVLIAALIKLDSPGPVFYRQTRVGKGGERFKLVKFRSMVPESDGSSKLTVKDDDRVTTIGRWMRRVNLDELPQLWNVLRGEMSLVGPRPDVPEFVDESDPLWQKVLSVRPGMTSPETLDFLDEGEILAQYEDPEKAYMDEILPRKLERAGEYVDERSLLTDLRILIGTFLRISAGNEGQAEA